MRPEAFLLFLFACIVAVMIFVHSLTSPASSYTTTTDVCVALVGCDRGE